jgi:hypothetical protein
MNIFTLRVLGIHEVLRSGISYVVDLADSVAVGVVGIGHIHPVTLQADQTVFRDCLIRLPTSNRANPLACLRDSNKT